MEGFAPSSPQIENYFKLKKPYTKNVQPVLMFYLANNSFKDLFFLNFHYRGIARVYHRPTQHRSSDNNYWRRVRVMRTVTIVVFMKNIIRYNDSCYWKYIIAWPYSFCTTVWRMNRKSLKFTTRGRIKVHLEIGNLNLPADRFDYIFYSTLEQICF